MTWLTHGLLLALAWFLMVNSLASLALGFAGRALAGRLAAAGRRSGALLLAMRLLPFLASTSFVVLVFAPSYVLLEPRVAGEEINTLLMMLAAAAAALIVFSLGRGWSAWRDTTSTAERLEAAGEPFGDVSGAAAFKIPVDQPAVLLVGAWRPRLLVTRGLMNLLSPTELDAALRHEASHLCAFDNLKRLAIRAVPDLWSWTPAARAIEKAWAAAAEIDADRAASSAGRAEALALAAAIVKVAQRTAAAPLLPCASPLVDGPDVAWRVRALLAEPESAKRNGPLPLAGAVLLGATIVLTYSPAIAAVHQASELLVRLL